MKRHTSAWCAALVGGGLWAALAAAGGLSGGGAEHSSGRPTATPNGEAPVERGPAAALAEVAGQPWARAPARTERAAAPEASHGAGDVPTPPSPPRDGRDIDPRQYESAEALLADHWGALWPAVQAELAEAGLELEAYPISEVPRWVDVLPTVQADLSAELQETRAAFAASEAPWSTPEGAVAALRAEGAATGEGQRPIDDGTWRRIVELNRGLESLATNLNAALEATLLESLQRPGVSTVHPIAFPRKTLGVGWVAPGEHLWLSTQSHDGWTIELALRADHAPEFASWLLEMDSLRDARRALLAAALGGDE